MKTYFSVKRANIWNVQARLRKKKTKEKQQQQNSLEHERGIPKYKKTSSNE